MRTLLILAVLVVLVLVGFIVSSEDFLAKPNRIGVIEIRGLISDSQETVKAIKKLRENQNVKAILLRIETPGGGVGPSQEVYREVRRTIEVKPVVASMGSIAASGGYYIASATNRIVANPGTITGSIGVISYFPNLTELFDKVGYSMVTIKSGQFKDVGNPARKMTPEEQSLIQATINETYNQFVRDVAAGRSLPEEKVRQVADGRVIMGETAFKLGLIDELGNYEDAVTVAAKLGKIEGEPEIIYEKKKKHSVIDFLLGGETSELVRNYLESAISFNFLRYQMP